MATYSAKSKWSFLHSLRFRLAARFVGVFTIILIVLCVFVYEKFNANNSLEFDRSLYNYSLDVAHAINIDPNGGVSFDVDTLIGNGKSFPFAIGHSFVQLCQLDGHIVGKSRDLKTAALPITLLMLDRVAKDHFFFQTVTPNDLTGLQNFPGAGYRQINLLVGSPRVPNFILQIAVPRTFLTQEKERMTQLFLIAVPIALLISLLAGIYMSRRAFKPIQLIIEKTRNFDPNNLDERLPLPPANDELLTLSTTLNALLERLQKMFVSQERFIADASHQLKTPLTILRGEIEIALKKNRTAEETQELLKSQVLELGFLSRVVDNLLLLARVEGGVAFLMRTPVRLDEVVLEGVSRFEKLAREKNVTIKLDLDHAEGVTDPFVVQGDEDLLKSLVSEMLGNAIKYSPKESSISVRVLDQIDFVSMQFIDKGPGVPEAYAERIFERFYRAPSKAGSIEAQGSGLGLSIAKKIAEIHGGKITYNNNGLGGSHFVIEIKKV